MSARGCYRCLGSGRVRYSVCPQCDGTGKVWPSVEGEDYGLARTDDDALLSIYVNPALIGRNLQVIVQPIEDKEEKP